MYIISNGIITIVSAMVLVSIMLTIAVSGYNINKTLLPAHNKDDVMQ